MFEAILFIGAVSVLYTNILKCTSGEHVSIEDNQTKKETVKPNNFFKKSFSCFQK